MTINVIAMKTLSIQELTKLKDDGNSAFKEENFDEAFALYSQAMQDAMSHEMSLKNEKSFEYEKFMSILLKNRAAVYLKQERYDLVIDDCNKSLELVPDDPKTLFRRCQAYDKLGKFELAYTDARSVHTLDPSNKVLQPILTRLHAAVSEKVTEMARVTNKVSSMMKIVFDPTEEKSKRQTGADNLIYLARERSGSEALLEAGVIRSIGQIMKVEKDDGIRLSMIRCVGELCKRSDVIVKDVLTTCGISFFLDILNSEKETVVNSAQHIIQVILDTLSDAKTGEKCKEMRKRPKTTSTAEKKWIVYAEKERSDLIKKSLELNSIFRIVVHNVTSRTISALARDALIEILMKNCKYNELNWAESMLTLTKDGYHRLLEVSSEMKEYEHESSMKITENTRSIVGVCLAFCYESLYDDKRRNELTEIVDEFVKEKLLDPSMEAKVRCVAAITTLLRHAVDLGQAQISKEGILSMMLEMARSDAYIMQLTACEALIAASTKKKDSSFIIQQGLDVLKTLYNSKHDEIKVRALVGLCKLGASGGVDASLRPFADGSTEKLAMACRKFLISSIKTKEETSNEKSSDTVNKTDHRKWAAEGLSYLTLDADVKEKLCEDENAIRAIIALAQDTNANKQQDLQYSIVTLFVNLTNSYDKQEIMPEMLELAKFAKHHIPQEHELDDQDFIDKRIFTLTNYGIVSALTALAKRTESNSVRELIARILNAICNHSDLRGLVVQQGGVSALCSIVDNLGCESDSNSGKQNTEKGRRNACQALARMGITQDPAIAFPGQRSIDVIRPIISLLNIEYNGLENFEALMALGNLASLNESTRSRILKNVDFVTQIESYMFEEHDLIKRAAVQCFANLCASPLQVRRCEGKNDKVKFCVLLCGDDDEEVTIAATAALAMLTSQSTVCCKKIFESAQWTECLLNGMANKNFEIVLRATVIIKNMIESGKEIAEKIIQTQLMDCLQAHIFKAQLDEGCFEPNVTLRKISETAQEALNAAYNMNLVKSKSDSEAEKAKRDEACVVGEDSD